MEFLTRCFRTAPKNWRAALKRRAPRYDLEHVAFRLGGTALRTGTCRFRTGGHRVAQKRTRALPSSVHFPKFDSSGPAAIYLMSTAAARNTGC